MLNLSGFVKFNGFVFCFSQRRQWDCSVHTYANGHGWPAQVSIKPDCTACAMYWRLPHCDPSAWVTVHAMWHTLLLLVVVTIVSLCLYFFLYICYHWCIVNLRCLQRKWCTCSILSLKGQCQSCCSTQSLMWTTPLDGSREVCYTSLPSKILLCSHLKVGTPLNSFLFGIFKKSSREENVWGAVQPCAQVMCDNPVELDQPILAHCRYIGMCVGWGNTETVSSLHSLSIGDFLQLIFQL